MEKLKMHSPDFTNQNIAQLAALFPNCVTEIKQPQIDTNEHQSDQENIRVHPGSSAVKKAIDWDLLKQELSNHIVEGPQERYRLDWPGKREALLAANAPIAKTLRPCREESVDFDITENLFIEGDNLDALKLLQETYLGKVKMIYIDPPYNTGKDFIYADNFAESSEEYLLDSGQKDEEGNRLVANTDSNGRFHSDWLSMMFSRLKLARNLLRDDGVIFISIDDGEQANLKRMCDEIFGEDNFVANIVWQKRYVSNVTAKWLSDMHDHILLYGRNRELVEIADWERTDEQKKAYKNPDSDPRGVWRAQDLSASRPYNAGVFTIEGPTGNSFDPPPNRYWRCNKKQFDEWCKDNRIWWGIDNDARPMLKAFLCESQRGITPHTWWSYDFAGHNKEATLELKDLFSGNAPFDTPKPTKLLSNLLKLLADKDAMIMDFFAGSSVTAHAVMQLNAEDGGNRKFIMVQLPEACDEKSEAFKAGYKTIAEISKERIRRAGKKIKEELTSKGSKDTKEEESLFSEAEQAKFNDAGPVRGSKDLDTGFRVLKIDSSNMADVYYAPDAVEQSDLFANTENIKPDRSAEDLLFQVLLDWGVDLTLPISREKMTVKGQKSDKNGEFEVFFVDQNALAACFAQNGAISEDFCKELAKKQPLRVVFRDSGFKDDSVKINVEQIFKLMSPHTEVKTI